MPTRMIAYDGVVSRGPEKSWLCPWWGHAGRFLTMSHPLDSLSDAAYWHLVEPIWNFLVISHVPAPSDVIFVFGSQDLAVPRRAAEFFSDGLAPCLLVTGGFGPMTEGVFPKPEALVFKDELIRLGVPGNAIVTEVEAGNTLENVNFGMSALREARRSVDSALLVAKAFVMRRCLATFGQQCPEIDALGCPPGGSLMAQRDRPRVAFGARLVAELERLDRYGAVHDIVPQDIPGTVRDAAEQVKAWLTTASSAGQP